jgi:glycosyltransferase involved in cell wall biosynthesis/SAM-dependent methyltransferase
MMDSAPHSVTLLDGEPRLAARTVNAEPLVSVILIFFNAVKFIDEAIQSVFAQHYPQWELLLVDDGSTDGSGEIAQRYAEGYPERVRYLEHAGHVNRGMSASRNWGIRHARGQYLAFLDADDVWLPRKLEHQVSILTTYPAVGMVLGPIQWWYSWTNKPEDCARDFVAQFPDEVQPDSLVQPPQLLIALLKKATVSTTSSLIRRDLVDRVGGFEENFRGLFEDQAFAAKVYLTAQVRVASACHYLWRKHPDSCCAVAVESAQYEHARLEFFIWLQRYLSQQRINHRELADVLDREMQKARRQELSAGTGNGQKSSHQIEARVKSLARGFIPATVRHRLWNWRHGSVDCPPPVGSVKLGMMRRLSPISRVWGFDRGLPVDRYYIERFLAAHASDIRGRVLEMGDDTYTRKFGAARVVQSDILHPVEGNLRTTIIADLTAQHGIPAEAFDCVVCTQTLMFIFDIHKAIRTLYRILKPGGVLLMTLAGVSQISRSDMERWGDYWRFTSLSARRLCESVFPPASVTVEAHGNVLVAVAFLHGLAREELHQEELDTSDPDYEVLITVRAVKPETIDVSARG